MMSGLFSRVDGLGNAGSEQQISDMRRVSLSLVRSAARQRRRKAMDDAERRLQPRFALRLLRRLRRESQ